MFEKEIKEDQPDLLKTICDIALYGSTTYKKKEKMLFNDAISSILSRRLL